MTKPKAISKSKFIRGVQCHKSLWLDIYKPELRDPQDDSAKAIMQSGTNVGELARELFPGGILIPYDNTPLSEQICLTAEAIQKSDVIYEGAFGFNNIFVKADIIRKTEQGWELYEVKSTTKVEDIYIKDVGIQYHVISGSGLQIIKVCIVHLNSHYIRKGDLDINRLFKTVDVTAKVLPIQNELHKEIRDQFAVLDNDEPNIDIGKNCHTPYACNFRGHCWKHIPEESVFSLAGKGINKFSLYRKGIIKLEDIPLNLLKGDQLQQAVSALAKSEYIDKKGIQDFLSTLWYPLCFLDFETFMSAIPLYDSMRPYQQIPFQYSLHILQTETSELEHKEYLADAGYDPREGLIDQLIHDIPPDACVLAYYSSFESTRLKEMAADFTDRAVELNRIILNIRDLIVPFKQRHLYSWKQKGSHSIKKVLPAFVDGLSYENMTIADGGAAMEAYHKMEELRDNLEELKKLKKDLLEYCGLDTYAMVELLKVLEKITI
jgi:hypothetical protein